MRGKREVVRLCARHRDNTAYFEEALKKRGLRLLERHGDVAFIEDEDVALVEMHYASRRGVMVFVDELLSAVLALRDIPRPFGQRRGVRFTAFVRDVLTKPDVRAAVEAMFRLTDGESFHPDDLRALNGRTRVSLAHHPVLVWARVEYAAKRGTKRGANE